MPGRFDLGPLRQGLLSGLRHRATVGEERPDDLSRTLLWWIPLGAASFSFVFSFRLAAADQMLAGFALLAGAALAAFSQLASWRERFTERGLRSEGISSRALDEAVAHVLFTVVAAVAGAVTTGILANLDPQSRSIWIEQLSRVVTACSMAIAAYLVLTLIIVVNLLFDAYTTVNNTEKRVASREADGDEQASA